MNTKIEKVKVRVKKLEGVVLVSEKGVVQYLWAIIGTNNMTLIQVYSSKEPTDLVNHIQKNYDKH